MNRSWAVVLVLLATAACGDDDPVFSGGGPVPVATLVPLSTSATCVAGGADLEGRFTASNQMKAYLECVLPALVQWQGEVYQQMPPPSSFQFVPAGFVGKDGGCELNDQALKYCKASQVVYFGEAAVWQQYTQFGDAAPAVIAAHEVVHHFQEVLKMPEPTVPNEVIRYENQADCGAGAFMAYARAQGYLDPDDDIVDLAGSLQAAGESEGPQRTHGTIEERLRAFDLAYLSDAPQPLAACAPFVPEVPILN